MIQLLAQLKWDEGFQRAQVEEMSTSPSLDNSTTANRARQQQQEEEEEEENTKPAHW